MFLDRQLRAIEASRQGLVMRCELHRRLAQMEVGAVKAATRRMLAEAAMGLAVAERVLAWFRKR